MVKVFRSLTRDILSTKENLRRMKKKKKERERQKKQRELKLPEESRK